MRDEHEIGAVFFGKEPGDQLFLFRLQVIGIANPAVVFFCDHLLGLRKGHCRDGRDFRNLHAQQRDLRRIVLLQQLHGILQHRCFHLHDVLKGINVAHFKVHGGIFV